VSALACDSVAQRAGLDQVAVLDTLDLGTAGATLNVNEQYGKLGALNQTF
jgi:hypothetical protein